ncbi:hypothetical protein SESBI_01630 [Sesbania bispinosa]|nr:hypothetical protein SESBI_01630 [Sesbania bispinosa]
MKVRCVALLTLKEEQRKGNGGREDGSKPWKRKNSFNQASSITLLQSLLRTLKPLSRALGRTGKEIELNGTGSGVWM